MERYSVTHTVKRLIAHDWDVTTLPVYADGDEYYISDGRISEWGELASSGRFPAPSFEERQAAGHFCYYCGLPMRMTRGGYECEECGADL
ncbi:MAG: hypothetical protein ACRDQA_23720 [Nocardioidaceae bacterium]